MRSGMLLLGATVMGLALAGCHNGDNGGAIGSDQFYDRRGAATGSPLSPADQPGAMYSHPEARPRPAEELSPPAPPPQAPAVPTTRQVSGNTNDPSAEMRQAVAATRPAVRTATTVGDSTGRYLTIGGVLADVNGTPIYVDKVLATLEKDLKARSMELDAARFREVAANLIEVHLKAVISNELVYANALRHLDAEEKGMADYATERYRQQKIAEAGGSVELARRKAKAEGIDFDELVQAKGREHVFLLYYERKVKPRIQITAEEMRQYYAEQRDTLFTKLDEAKFRLIKVDPTKQGADGTAAATTTVAARDKALKKAQELRQRAMAGESFEALAGDYNDDARLKKQGGDVGSVQRGAYRLTKVEEAVFALQVGQVTSIVEDEGAFYIARLEERKAGQVQAFESEEVQRRIIEALQQRHLKELRDRDEQRLMSEAIARRNPDQMEAAIQLAMQKYAEWRGK